MITFICLITELSCHKESNKSIYNEIEMDLYFLNLYFQNKPDTINYWLRANDYINVEAKIGIDTLLIGFKITDSGITYQLRGDSITIQKQKKLISSCYNNMALFDSVLFQIYLRCNNLIRLGFNEMSFVSRKNYSFISLRKKNILYIKSSYLNIDILDLKKSKYKNWYYKVYNNK